MPWLGPKGNMTVNAGDLELDAGAQEGEYLLLDGGGNPYFDTGFVGVWRINALFDAKEGTVSPDDDTNEISVKLFIGLNSLNPATPGDWSAYVPFLPGEYTCRYYRIKVVVKVDDAYGNRPKLTEFTPSHTPAGSVSQPSSVDAIEDEPVGGEEVGHRYLVDPVPAGIFATHANKIAEKIDSTNNTWRFYIPIDGQWIYNITTRWWLKYEGNYSTGAWVERDHYRNQNVSEGLSTTSSASFVQKHTMTTVVLLTGAIYRIGYQFEVGVNSTAARSEYQVQIDNLITIAQPFFAPGGGPANVVWDLMSGFFYITGAGSTILIDIDFRRASAAPGDVAKIRRARIEIQRVG